MKIVAISDTHSNHNDLILPECDLLLHSGDITYFSKKGMQEVVDFLTWFHNQPAKNKVFIAGNHDILFEKEESFFRTVIPPGITYLNDEMVTIEGVNIWGSPYTPWFHDWAFNRRRGAEIKKHWDLIPDNTDILLTHGPAYGILDMSANGNVGCQDLLSAINRVMPRIHCFGHIHQKAHKSVEINGKIIEFYNAAMVDGSYKIKKTPHVFEFFK